MQTPPQSPHRSVHNFGTPTLTTPTRNQWYNTPPPTPGYSQLGQLLETSSNVLVSPQKQQQSAEAEAESYYEEKQMEQIEEEEEWNPLWDDDSDKDTTIIVNNPSITELKNNIIDVKDESNEKNIDRLLLFYKTRFCQNYQPTTLKEPRVGFYCPDYSELPITFIMVLNKMGCDVPLSRGYILSKINEYNESFIAEDIRSENVPSNYKSDYYFNNLASNIMYTRMFIDYGATDEYYNSLLLMYDKWISWQIIRAEMLKPEDGAFKKKFELILNFINVFSDYGFIGRSAVNEQFIDYTIGPKQITFHREQAILVNLIKYKKFKQNAIAHMTCMYLLSWLGAVTTNPELQQEHKTMVNSPIKGRNMPDKFEMWWAREKLREQWLLHNNNQKIW
jgi:hypothetical protein